jgi:hypothetical protein
MSVFSLADSRSSWLRSDSRTGVTIDQWWPTGQYCSLHHHRRTHLIDTAGFQIVLYTCPWRHLTAMLPPSRPVRSQSAGPPVGS